MILKNIKKYLLLSIGVSIIGTSCFKDLDTVPLDPDEVTAATVYEDPAAYRQVLAKLYAGLAVSGQEGPAGKADIQGIDEGFGQYLRALWYHQEFTTDEAVVGWNDQTIQNFHSQNWDASDVFIAAFYSRIFYQISLCNEYLRETEDSRLDARSVSGDLRNQIAGYRAEARFLRALSYFHALDHFGNVPFVTEADAVGSFFPSQIAAPDLYSFITSELLEIETLLPAPRANEYGRADQGAVWTLLAKVFLNAEVYTGKNEATQAVNYCQKVIDAGYSLESKYDHLFMADNHNSNEIIFPVNFDGVNTRTWGGMTFLTHAGVGGSMPPSAYGIDGGWSGVRVTKALVEKFPAVAGDGGGGVIVAPNDGETRDVIYVPGAYNGWNPADAEATIASPDGTRNFEGYIYFAEADAQFKITDGPSWAMNYGDTDMDGVLELNGGNLTVSEPGFYKLNVSLNDFRYTLVKTNWGVIGSATPGGWDDDTDMTYDEDEKALVVDLFLTAGEIKFRADDAWDLNYGDTGADAILIEGGDNIQIPANGNYRVKLFLDKPDYTYSLETTSSDSRAMFYTDGQNLEIEDISQFTEGYASTKFKNIDSQGNTGSDLTFPDTDFPMFRLADVYLMYAEGVLRNGGGDRNAALGYLNAIRERAYGDPSGNITDADMDLPYILDERARELHWEGHRRTDLIRFGQFSNGTYLWPWKGGVKEGQVVEPHFDLFPIPAADRAANPNLEQNDGY